MKKVLEVKDFVKVHCIRLSEKIMIDQYSFNWLPRAGEKENIRLCFNCIH